MTDDRSDLSTGISLLNEHQLVVGRLAEVAVSCMEYASERERWKGRIDSLRLSFDKYGETEATLLENRRLATDLVRFTIEKLIDRGDTQAVVRVIENYNETGPDLLGSVSKLITDLYKT